MRERDVPVVLSKARFYYVWVEDQDRSKHHFRSSSHGEDNDLLAALREANGTHGSGKGQIFHPDHPVEIVVNGTKGTVVESFMASKNHTNQGTPPGM